MKSTIGNSTLLAAALCVTALAGCDSIKDVRDEPITTVPPKQVVLQGTINGLGSRRPVKLQNNGDSAGALEFFGAFGATQSPFSFGAYALGTPFDITVQTQPYGKSCTVVNGTGTVGPEMAPVSVNCENDDSVTRYAVTVDTTVAAALPNLKVTLTTEEGVLEQDATGASSVVFPEAIFNSATSLPLFEFKVTATFDTTVDGVTTANYCTFVPVGAGAAPITMGGRNRDATDTVVVPTGPVSVTLNACGFTVDTTVAYSGAPAQAMPSGGLQLGLKNHFTAEVVQTLDVGAYAAAVVVPFAEPVRSNAESIHELVVTRQPDGHHCVVSGNVTARSYIINSTAGSNVTAPTGNGVLFVDPDMPEWWTPGNRNVRCRAVPDEANRLTGTYQRDRPLPSEANAEPARAREFLTFFADGTFLHGINFTGIRTAADGTIDSNATAALNNGNAASGVTHGFYNYNPGAGTIAFTVFTASAINPSNMGLNGMPGYAMGSVTASAVVKSFVSPGSISLTFVGNRPAATFGGAAGTTPQMETWNMTEPESKPGELTGTWVTPDHLRVFAYNDNETFGFHMGVNGLPNLQDTCYLVDDFSTQMGGHFARHGASTFNCLPGGSAFASRDIPHYAVTGAGRTMPRIPPGFHGRFPGAQNQLDNRPTSPDVFSVTAGAPDLLVVQGTLNGVPIDQPIEFVRERAN